MVVEDPQALILAGVAILAVLYIVRWQTDPVSTPQVVDPNDTLMAQTAEVHPHRGRAFRTRTGVINRAQVRA